LVKGLSSAADAGAVAATAASINGSASSRRTGNCESGL
jgi:hypothetical protein